MVTGWLIGRRCRHWEPWRGAAIQLPDEGLDRVAPLAMTFQTNMVMLLVVNTQTAAMGWLAATSDGGPSSNFGWARMKALRSQSLTQQRRD